MQTPKVSQLIYVAIDYFFEFHRVAFLKLFCFFKSGRKSPADFKIWDDSGVGSKVPSTPADPSKGSKTIPPKTTALAGTSKGSSAAQGEKGVGAGKALIIGPLPKLLAPKKLPIIKAPM